MRIDVLCLRPVADFERVNAPAPPALHVAYRSPDAPDLKALMSEARALLIPAVGPKIPASLFENASITFVQVTGAGLDRLDLPMLKARKIVVANVPGGSNLALSEYAVTSASLLLRRLVWANSEIRLGNYSAFRARMVADNLAGLEGLLVGVIGLGTIGQAVAEAFSRMGCRICYYDPAPRDVRAAEAISATSRTLSELLQLSDVITLHVPLLPQTRGLIGEKEFAQMKRGVILIQASRGGIVDELSLADYLKTGHIGGAAVDVYSTEPPEPGHALLSLQGDAAQRLLLTPHIAGVTQQSATFLFRAAWNNILRALGSAEPPQNCAP